MRGRYGVQWIASDAHEGLKSADSRILAATFLRRTTRRPSGNGNGICAEVVWIFLNGPVITRLVSAIPRGQNNEWAMRRSRDMILETIAPVVDDPKVNLPTMATRHIQAPPATDNNNPYLRHERE